ncbi:hypothetical protein Bbelb_258420 [Branchiostoma belcheri]|nr:hypothetical protein Bbelb_258420 [Branchiostoma belcheri]
MAEKARCQTIWDGFVVTFETAPVRHVLGVDAGRRHDAERAPYWTRPVPGQSPVLTRAACGRVPTGSYSSAGQLSGPWRVPGGIPTGSSRVFEQEDDIHFNSTVGRRNCDRADGVEKRCPPFATTRTGLFWETAILKVDIKYNKRDVCVRNSTLKCCAKMAT